MKTQRINYEMSQKRKN